MKSDNINDIYLQLCTELSEKETIKRHGKEIKEIIGASFILTNIENNIVSLKERKLDIEYLNAELNWYSKGDRNVNKIGQKASMWLKICSVEGYAESNYGYFVFRQLTNGISEYKWCYHKLIEDINTRQALINYNQPKHKYDTNKDFPCTISQSFLYNPNTKTLDSFVFMRSTDIIYGLSYDVPWFCHVHKLLAWDLGLIPGDYHHYSISMHVYKKHFDMIDNIIEESK